ncbi:MAG: hypothetical protein CVU99_02385 [Firmicutes bacterium HGW-Firmicutes-4]|jgi:hypothetical protein|nr:MAG: hypothetical protein CVU99_02385 [Firmicutes bacterium HGW-Firmicutes-4]
MYELDILIKRIIKDRLAELNTTMQCTVTNLSPLSVRPIPVKNYVTGAVEYPEIGSVKKLKEWGLNSAGAVVEIEIPLQVGNTVLVAFGKDNLSDAIILGVVDS